MLRIINISKTTLKFWWDTFKNSESCFLINFSNNLDKFIWGIRTLCVTYVMLFIYAFRMNPQSAFATMSRKYLLKSGAKSISPYSVRMLENAGKMRTAIIPNPDTFYAVLVSWIVYKVFRVDSLRASYLEIKRKE